MFDEQVFSLLTQHGKEKVIAPILEEKLNKKLKHTDAFDTDQLGTFTGEVRRELTPVQTAIKKARLACELTGSKVGLGSEGSFFISPAGIGTVNEEMIALVLRDVDFVVVGRHFTPVDIREAECNDSKQISDFITQAPEGQGLVLKSNDHLAKGLHGESEILETMQRWFGKTRFDKTTISYDLRAHQSPIRQSHIARATENLVERLLQHCPNCDYPGYWPDRPIKGLPCEACSAPTIEFRAYTAECGNCHHQEEFPVDRKKAEARYCMFCNP